MINWKTMADIPSLELKLLRKSEETWGNLIFHVNLTASSGYWEALRAFWSVGEITWNGRDFPFFLNKNKRIQCIYQDF